jgi:uncharacterized protein CbrC (UPF0167 family)
VTDSAGVGGYGGWDEVDKRIVDIIAFRTPGFIGWQPERWWAHCQDAGEFLGPMGKAELNEFGDQAVKVIREESGLEGDELDEYMEQLDRERGPTAYLFQCRHCKRYGGYSDIH